MNSTITLNIIRFILLFALQILVFNNIELFNFINPLPYILFILLFPIHGNKALLIFISFLLGLGIDMFENSGGVHAAACVVLAYFRADLLKFSYGISYEYHTIKIADKIGKELFTYLFSGVLLHHTILFGLEIFRFNFIWEILLRTLLTTLFTLILCVLIIYLIKPSKK
ncbi:rod shape-determining protein MreD [Flavobacterium sp. NKUCC04_CG]|uniref:rod shape-determining protein MreD n=1 Tax=Flavobacterium sp. NKUCC04_CG TaxID=2842121 RepID=UPI001C5AF9DD|nr:rod shape-determining protein MreD [Flavobacterium sp. NKUCC04_CG]MBW3518162.1 rod shape-determining protein MreD [Flavobacterium sp. NKUCC04_CG]